MSNIFYILSKLMARVYQEQCNRKKSFKVVSVRPNRTQHKTLQYWNTFIDTVQKDRLQDSVQLDGVDASEKSENGIFDDFVFIGKGKRQTHVEDLSDDAMKSDELVYIDQEDFCSQIFTPVIGNPVTYATKLIPYVLEFIRCLRGESIRIKSCVFELLIDLSLKSDRLYMLHQYFQYGLIDDSYHIACQLLSVSPSYAPCYQLAIDMLRRLGGQELILSVLLAKGEVIAAIHLIQRTPKPLQYKIADLLAVASKDPDPTTLYLVYNFFAVRQPTNKAEDIKALNKARARLTLQQQSEPEPSPAPPSPSPPSKQ